MSTRIAVIMTAVVVAFVVSLIAAVIVLAIIVLKDDGVQNSAGLQWTPSPMDAMTNMEPTEMPILVPINTPDPTSTSKPTGAPIPTPSPTAAPTPTSTPTPEPTPTNTPIPRRMLVYDNNFNGTIGPEWSQIKTETSPQGNRRFLGRFGPETATLRLSRLADHCEVEVTFDLYIIGSWDGSDGPDVWGVSADGKVLFATTFTNYENRLQTYPNIYPNPEADSNGFTGAAEQNTLGYDYNGNSLSAVYNMEFSFPHSGGTLRIDFTGGSGLQSLQDESWGIDNLQVVSITC